MESVVEIQMTYERMSFLSSEQLAWRDIDPRPVFGEINRNNFLNCTIQGQVELCVLPGCPQDVGISDLSRLQCL